MCSHTCILVYRFITSFRRNDDKFEALNYKSGGSRLWRKFLENDEGSALFVFSMDAENLCRECSLILFAAYVSPLRM